MASASRLEKLESVIEEFQNARLKAGRALREIKKRKLYEEAGYSSFGIYVQKRFGFRSSWRSALVKYARVFDLLDGEGNGTPENEAQARYLGRLLDTENEKNIPEIWELAVQRHGLSNITMAKVKESIDDYLAGEDRDEEEPERSGISMKLPSQTAQQLGLSGNDYRGRRIVSWNGYTRDEIQAIIDEVEPKDAKPPNFDGEPVLADRIWRPMMGEETTGHLQTKFPDRVIFRPTQAPRLEESTKLTLESPTTLTCPGVDLLSDGVPDPLTEEILDRSSGTDWEPVHHSVHHESWTDYDLPTEGWIGSSASRSSIEEVADSLDAADDTENKWILYDLGSEDKQTGLPETDFSPIDWVVIDSLTQTHLTYGQLHQLVETAKDRNVALAVRNTFDTKLESSP